MISRERRATSRGHVCWTYDDPEALADQAERHLAASLAAGERFWYITPQPSDQVAERLRALPHFAAAVRRGAAAVVPLVATYSPDHVVDPATQVAAYAAATDEALAAGHTGLRVVAEATELVHTPAKLDVFTRYEHQIDRYMCTRPFAALCAYHRPRLSDRAVTELACMHPESNVEGLLFRLYAVAPGDGHAALAGELDMSNHELFRTALDRADLRPTDGELVLSAADLRFLDHRALTYLAEYASRRGATAVLRTPRPATTRLVDLLDLPGIRVEVTP
ncbi:MEDS domain-containing protein [Micromonospora peucetia]|uniref:MEDS domain-containing protein n=1 Tax=Micromonospora peucetia TaxID=47871 RepID=A0A1C6ULX8_9ACTN|nr:MEDS domain-containing protein [Micromonospora peucetia]MCX4387005.1 MEDS domain-containing protein [Micromonospora peucetia]WSA34373.1 MEDS domain-containing protein [Micromonospora peucetia]SCL54991.1 STAS domain-containing protein [Micromonospora peucetia]